MKAEKERRYTYENYSQYIFASLRDRQSEETQSHSIFPPSNLYIFSHKVPAFGYIGGELDKVVEGMRELDRLALPDYLIQDGGTGEAGKSKTGISNFSYTGQLPFFKPPPENKFLRQNWTQNNFVAGLIWAVSWGQDLMPRKYVRINNVVSTNQVRISFLEPLSVLDHEIESMREGIPIVTGFFKLSERSAIVEMSPFSYLVKCQENSNKSCYNICPLKGEIWAIYNGWCWNTKWKLSDHLMHQFRRVQVLSQTFQKEMGRWLLGWKLLSDFLPSLAM